MSQKVLAGCELRKSLPHESRVSGQSRDGGDGGDGSVAGLGEGGEVGGEAQGGGGVGHGSLGGQVGGPGSLDGRLVHRDDGSVGMSDQLGVEVQRTSVACNYRQMSTAMISI